MNYIKLNRVSKDIGIFGPKGIGKTTTLSIFCYIFWRYGGFDIYSNYRLNIPHIFVNSVNKLDRLLNDPCFNNFKPKILAVDDGERWFFSRNSFSSKSKSILNLLLDFGKCNCSIYTTLKREMALDIGLRESLSEFWELELIPKYRNPKYQYVLNSYMNCIKIRIWRFNNNLESLPTWYIDNLHLFRNVFDTSHIVKPVKNGASHPTGFSANVG